MTRIEAFARASCLAGRSRCFSTSQQSRSGDPAVYRIAANREFGGADRSGNSSGISRKIGKGPRKPFPVSSTTSPFFGRETSQAGFTLVEVLVVLSIIGLVVGLIGPRVVGYLSDAKIATARIQATTLSNAVELFYIDNGRYPLNAEGLQALIAPPTNLQSWNGPYLKAAAVPRDPWGKPYHYVVQNDGRSFLIGFDGSDRRGSNEEAEVQKRNLGTRGALPR